MDFWELTDFSASDLLSLINNGVEESAHLDFKEAGALAKNDKKKGDIAKDISAFANSDGGIIVYGIEEKGHQAHSVSYIDGNEFTKEWLEQVINTNITPVIDDLSIIPIRINGDVEKTIYIVKVPRSARAPHMSHDKRYYHRINFMSVPMEEFQVRDLFYRRNKSKLSIQKVFCERINEGRPEKEIRIGFFASVGNNSTVTETLYKLNYYFTDETGIRASEVHWEPHKSSINYSHIKNGIKVSATGTEPLFPDEAIDFGRFTLSIKTKHLQHFLKNTRVKALLLFQNGSDEMSFDLSRYYSEYNANGE